MRGLWQRCSRFDAAAIGRVSRPKVAQGCRALHHYAAVKNEKVTSSLAYLCAALGVTSTGLMLVHADENKHSGASFEDKWKDYRPTGDAFVRLDQLLHSTHKQYHHKNAIHDTLQGNNLIETYEIYHNKENGEIHCVVHFGDWWYNLGY